jgi:predicted flap endonuclease-1-like 5' DNA nuclease
MLRFWYLIVGFCFGLFIGQLTSRSGPVGGQYHASRGSRAGSSAASATADDLTAIDGVGPAYVRALNELGIFTFAELAAQSPDDLAERMQSVRVTAERIRRESWIEQAQARTTSRE